MDLEEICGYLKATPSTIRAYLTEGMTEVGFKVGKEWRFLPLDVVDWLKRRRQRQAARQQKTTKPRRSTPRSGHSQIDRFLDQHWPERG
jgi:hypothetical protein